MIVTHWQPMQQRKAYGMLFLALICSSSLLALDRKDRDRFDSIAARYAREHAVYTSITERIEIVEESGELRARGTSTLQKLFISEQSLTTFNTDEVMHGGVFYGYDANSWQPDRQGYKKVPCKNFTVTKPQTYVFYDNSVVAGVKYNGLVKNTVTETIYNMEYSAEGLPSFNFQYPFAEVRVLSAKLIVEAPSYVDMKFSINGTNTDWIKQEKTEKNGRITYTFYATDVPAYKHFSNIPSFTYAVPHIIPYISSYKFPDAKKAIQVYSSTEELYKKEYLYLHDRNMKEDTFITETVEMITKNDRTQREKAAHIYDWVQKNIHYVAIENGLEGVVPREAALVCKRKFGDCKDMSSVTMAMCRKVGIKAYFAIIGSNSIPYRYENTPLPNMNNHMICALDIDGQWIFVDGTHPYLPFGKNRSDLQGKEAMIAMDEKNFKIVTIPVEPMENNTTTDMTRLTVGEAVINGSSAISMAGHPAWDMIFGTIDAKGDEADKLFRKVTMKGSNKYHLKKHDISITDEKNKTVALNAEFAIPDYMQQAGKERYINMHITKRFEDDRINEPARKVNYYFPYQEKIKEVVELELPKGWRVTYLPKNAEGTVDGVLAYKISYKNDGKKITLTKEYALKTMSIAPAQFAATNKAIDDLKRIYKETVVLTAK